MSVIAGHYCGQVQPHEAHGWKTPVMYGHIAVTSERQCAGLAASVEPGLCWNDSGIVWPSGSSPRCELRAGHAGAHECDRGVMGGSAVWTDGDDEAAAS